MTIKADFFEKMYKRNSDPWNFALAPYELYRYERICKIINHRKHHLVFEAGCSIGVLTEKLSKLASNIESIDVSQTAIAQAQQRCQRLNNVKISCSSLENHSFDKAYDLIILSEIGYYFDVKEWKKTLQHIISCCPAPLYLLASHWLGQSEDHLISGDEVHAVASSLEELKSLHSEQHTNFRLDYWMKK